MGFVIVFIFVNIIFGNGFVLNGLIFEFDVVSVNISVNDISDNIVVIFRIVKVFLESGEVKFIFVGDMGEILGGVEFSGNVRGGNVDLFDLFVRCVVIDVVGNFESGYDLVFFDIGYFGSSLDGVKGVRGKFVGCCRIG